MIDDVYNPTMEDLIIEMDKAEHCVCEIATHLPDKSFLCTMFSLCAVRGEDGEENVGIKYVACVFPHMDGNKVEMFYEFGKQLVVNGTVPLLVILALEAWVSESNKPVPDVMPSQDPNRREVLTISSCTYNGHILGRMIPIYRNVNGHIVLATKQSINSNLVECRLITAIVKGAHDAVQCLKDGEPVVVSGRYEETDVTQQVKEMDQTIQFKLKQHKRGNIEGV